MPWPTPPAVASWRCCVLSWPTMSGHFTVLREADLIAADRNGTTITYHLNLSEAQTTPRSRSRPTCPGS